jgi:hypothetical protein
VGDQGETRPSPSFDELERALSSVPGIVAASVVVSDETGRGRLRIRLAPGEDPDAASWAVAATLRERFGIVLDPETIRPRLEDDDASSDDRAQEPEQEQAAAPAAPAATAPDHSERLPHEPREPGEPSEPREPGEPSEPREPGEPSEPREPGEPSEPGERSAPALPATAPSVSGAEAILADPAQSRVRAALRDLVTRQGEREVEVVATLQAGGRQGRAEAQGLPTRRGAWRAVAEATVGALRQLTGGHLRAGVDRVTVTAHDEVAMATVVVTVLSDRGEETLLGASLLRDDPEAAVMRATLDALNRRVEPWLPQPVHT